MKDVKVISHHCLPSKMPVGTLIAIWLLMDRFAAPEWVRGVYWTLTALIVVGVAIAMFRERHQNVPGFGERS